MEPQNLSQTSHISDLIYYMKFYDAKWWQRGIPNINLLKKLLINSGKYVLWIKNNADLLILYKKGV